MKLSYSQSYLLSVAVEAVQHFKKKYEAALLHDEQQIKILTGQDKINRQRLDLQVMSIKENTNSFIRWFKADWKYEKQALEDLNLPRKTIKYDFTEFTTYQLKTFADQYEKTAPDLLYKYNGWLNREKILSNCLDSTLWLTDNEAWLFSEFLIGKQKDEE